MKTQANLLSQKVLPLVLLLFAVGTAFWGCKDWPKPEKQTQEIGIKDLKAMHKEILTKRYNNTSFTVQGYFVATPEPMLLTDLKWLQVNMPIPESEYILLKGKGIENIETKESKLPGALIQVKGKAGFRPGFSPDKYDLELDCRNRPELIREADTVLSTGYISLCDKYPHLCEYLTRSEDYALLYSGGINSVNAHSRYWNDLKFMYHTLRSKYGYSDENIVVVYKDGVAEDGEMPVDFAASVTGVNDAFHWLQVNMTSADQFFVFITNHGGGYEEATGINYGGRLDFAPTDEIDAYNMDEAIYYYEQTDNSFWDDHLADKFNCLNFSRMIGVFEPCFSGGLLHDLAGTDRILMSACTEFEPSWAHYTIDYDMFSYYFTCAINEADHLGTAVDADSNDDGRVSILEAFEYAKANDTRPETPMLEDSGNGAGMATPGTTVEDGVVAAVSFL